MNWKFSIAVVNLDHDVASVPGIRTKTIVDIRETTRINFPPLPYPSSYSKEGNKMNVKSIRSDADKLQARF